MRITDNMMSGNFLTQLNNTKTKVERLRSEIASGTKVNKPSDSPEGAGSILRLNKQLGQSDAHLKNIENSNAFMQETTFSMESIQSEIVGIMTKVAELKNATNLTNLNSFADQIDLSLKAILDAANSQSDGKYIFGGTDFSSKPFGYTSNGSAIVGKVNDLFGDQKVKVSQNISQKININGGELFGKIASVNGNLDSTSVIGSTTSSTVNLKAVDGSDLTLSTTYTKTAANTYDMTYDIVDSTSTSIFSAPPAAVEVVHDASTGEIQTVNGYSKTSISISNPKIGIDVSLDLGSVSESGSAASISLSIDREMDVLNAIIKIRDDLRNGIVPTEEYDNILGDFNKHVLDKLVQAGNIINQMEDTEELLVNQQVILHEMLSNVQDVDLPKAIMELQNQDYILQMGYKLYSSILPKSLMDYL